MLTVKTLIDKQTIVTANRCFFFFHEHRNKMIRFTFSGRHTDIFSVKNTKNAPDRFIAASDAPCSRAIISPSVMFSKSPCLRHNINERRMHLSWSPFPSPLHPRFPIHHGSALRSRPFPFSCTRFCSPLSSSILLHCAINHQPLLPECSLFPMLNWREGALLS